MNNIEKISKIYSVINDLYLLKKLTNINYITNLKILRRYIYRNTNVVYECWYKPYSFVIAEEKIWDTTNLDNIYQLINDFEQIKRDTIIQKILI